MVMMALRLKEKDIYVEGLDERERPMEGSVLK